MVLTPNLLERIFVYYPIREIDDHPSSIGLEYEDVSLMTGDGLSIHSWFIPHPDSRTTLLVFHGNAGNIGHRVPWISMLHAAGANVMMVDYRGYGRSQGNPHEKGLYLDADAAYRWWSSEHGGEGRKLVLLGESLGGAVAVDLASKVPITAIILQSTFTNAWDMAMTILPLGLLQPLVGVHFDSSSKIRDLACPKLFIHGNRDEIVPFRLGRKLFEQAPGPKDFYEVTGAGHNDLPWVGGKEYVDRLRFFLESLE